MKIALLCVLATVVAVSAMNPYFTNAQLNALREKEAPASMMRRSISLIASERGVSFSQAKEMMLEYLHNTPMTTLGYDPIPVAKMVEEAFDPVFEANLAIGVPRVYGAINAKTIVFFPFTVPTTAANQRLNVNYKASSLAGSNFQAGLIFGAPGVKNEDDRFLSQFSMSLSLFQAAVQVGAGYDTPDFPACYSSMQGYAGTTAYAWAYWDQTSTSTGASGFTITVSVVNTTTPCVWMMWNNPATTPLIGNYTGTFNFVQVMTQYASARRLTVSVTNGGTVGGVTFAPQGSLAGVSTSSSILTRKANEVVSMMYISGNPSDMPEFSLSATTWSCNLAAANMSGCPQLSTNFPYWRVDSASSLALAAFDLALAVTALFGGSGICGTGLARTYTCTSFFPRCDANNFPLPVCDSLFADYSTCAETSTQSSALALVNNGISQTSGTKVMASSPSMINPTLNTPSEDALMFRAFKVGGTVDVDCYRYPFNSASALTPVFGVIVALVAALLF